MNKFNLPRRDIQKERRQKRAERRKQKASVKAASAGNNKDGALAVNVSTGGYISGKRKAKLTKSWRRAQKEALQSGLVTMDDIEMMASEEDGGTTDEGAAQPSVIKSKKKFSMKKRAKLRSRPQGSGAVVASDAGADGEDAMMQ